MTSDKSRLNFGSSTLLKSMSTIIDIQVLGDYIYLSNQEGLTALKKDLLSELSLVGHSSFANLRGNKISVVNGFVYLASSYNGLVIFNAFSSLKAVTIVIIASTMVGVLLIAAVSIITIRKRTIEIC